jgi:dTDP-4-dehydrorhamnose 3,5-epimerase
MKIIDEPLDGLFVLQPIVYGDERGYFFESFRDDFCRQIGIKKAFVQDNQSLSAKNILRGLHFQAPPFAQAKFVNVVRGSVLDVVVDIRNNSKTYGHHFAIELSEMNHIAMYIPEGFAHGFYTLEEDTLFTYKCSQYYHPETEGGLAWNCPDLAIDWGAVNPKLSEKDKINPMLKDFKSPF